MTKRLFSYCIPIDDGAAPNPFGGVCTLAICKPAIRRVAKVGDWIVGTGGRNVKRIGKSNFSGCMVYAMQVTDIKTMKDYDAFTKQSLPIKIATPYADKTRISYVGDSIYDFSELDKDGKPKMRLSVHRPEDRDHDLGGVNVLLSTNYFYFGDNAIPLPIELRSLARNQQGHRSNSNQHLLKSFKRWIHSLRRQGYQPNKLHGKPQLWKGGQIEEISLSAGCGRRFPKKLRNCSVSK